MLVATDIAARGVHVDEVQLVVHVDPPAEHKAYLHRSGRTARAGSAGDVVTVVLPEQRKDASALMRRAGIAVHPQQVTAQSDSVTKLVGDIASTRPRRPNSPPRRPLSRDAAAPLHTPARPATQADTHLGGSTPAPVAGRHLETAKRIGLSHNALLDSVHDVGPLSGPQSCP